MGARDVVEDVGTFAGGRRKSDGKREEGLFVGPGTDVALGKKGGKLRLDRDRGGEVGLWTGRTPEEVHPPRAVGTSETHHTPCRTLKSTSPHRYTRPEA